MTTSLSFEKRERRNYSLSPGFMKPAVGDQLHRTNSEVNTTSDRSSADDIKKAVGRFNVGPKLTFYVAFDLSGGGEAQPDQVIIPKDESYDKFLGRLCNTYDGSFKTPLHRWDYVLVNRQYDKADPLPLTSPNTYYAMVSELLRSRSPWRHAVIRRSVSLTLLKKSDAKLIGFSIPITQT